MKWTEPWIDLKRLFCPNLDKNWSSSYDSSSVEKVRKHKLKRSVIVSNCCFVHLKTTPCCYCQFSNIITTSLENNQNSLGIMSVIVDKMIDKLFSNDISDNIVLFYKIYTKQSSINQITITLKLLSSVPGIRNKMWQENPLVHLSQIHLPNSSHSPITRLLIQVCSRPGISFSFSLTQFLKNEDNCIFLP